VRSMAGRVVKCMQLTSIWPSHFSVQSTSATTETVPATCACDGLPDDEESVTIAGRRCARTWTLSCSGVSERFILHSSCRRAPSQRKKTDQFPSPLSWVPLIYTPHQSNRATFPRSASEQEQAEDDKARRHCERAKSLLCSLSRLCFQKETRCQPRLVFIRRICMLFVAVERG
jgi:hypothetical protein